MTLNETMIEQIKNEIIRGCKDTKLVAKYGDALYNQAREQLKKELLSPQHFFAKQANETRQYFRIRSVISNSIAHRVSKADHQEIVALILNAIRCDTKPSVIAILQAHGSGACRSAEWAKRVSTQTHSRKMMETLQMLANDSLITELRNAGIYSQTFKGMLLHSTYSGFAEIMYRAVSMSRSRLRASSRIKELEIELAACKTELARTRSSLDKTGLWKDEALKMRTQRMSLGAISKALGVPKSTINDHLKTRVVSSEHLCLV